MVMPTWAESTAENGEIVYDGGNSAKSILVDVDGILKQGFQVVRAIIISQTLVGAQLLKDVIKTKHVGVEASELRGGLLMEITGVVILDRR